MAPTFTVLEHEPLRERVYQELKNALTKGKFAPGQTITIRGVAEELGTSATPVREALRQLIAERALEIRSNRSVAVPIMTASMFRELVDIRAALEGMAAEKAASLIRSADMEALKRFHHEMVGTIDGKDGQRYLSLNEKFHFTIYRAARAPLLLSSIEQLWLQIGPFFNNLFLGMKGSRHLHVHHADAIGALSRKDGAAAARAIRSDIGSAAEHLIHFTQGAPSEERARANGGK